MARGTVKRFNEEKGYGFIALNDGNEDLFVHHTGIVGSGCESLEKGASVPYGVAQGRKVCRRQTFLSALPTARTAGAQGTPCAYRWDGRYARILAGHFHPDYLYWAMAETVRRTR